jgi:hypothetical protein
MTEEQKNYELIVSDPSAVAMAEAAKARIQAAYLMALKKPRSEDEARIRILEACRRPEFAARVEYNKPISGTKGIKGPSIRFAETALRLWGNIESDIQVIYDDDKIRRVKVRLTDLQTNASYTKELSVKKTVERKSTKGRDASEIYGERLNSWGEKVYIVAATDDEMLTKESALISKAIRTEGLRLIPSDIIDDALATARETISKHDAQDPAAAKKRLFDSFAGIGVRPKEIEKYLKHSIDTISPAELQDLRGVYQAIKEGDATWADYVQTDELQEPAKPIVFNDEQKAPRKRRTKEEMEAAKAITNEFEPPAQETITREPGDEDQANLSQEQSELEALKAELKSLEESKKYHVLEAKKRTKIAVPQNIDEYNDLIRAVWEIVNEKK